MGVNLPFKNVILTTNKYTSTDGDYRNDYFTSMSKADVENMGGRAGRLNQKEKKGEIFGRVIFLAPSLLSETVVQNLYFNALKSDNSAGMPQINDPRVKYNSAPTATTQVAQVAQDTKMPCRPNFLLKEIAKGINTEKKLENRFKELTSDLKKDDHYWVFDFEKDDFETEIKESLKILIEDNLIKYGKKDKEAEKLFLSPSLNLIRLPVTGNIIIRVR